MPVTIRPARSDDALAVFRVAMLPDVRAASVRSDEFTLEQHMEWWARRYGSPNTLIWIVELDGQPAGYVRYSRITRGEPIWSGGPIAAEDGPAEVSIAIEPRWRNRGVATTALRLTAAAAQRTLGVDALIALILPSNIASQRAFERVGYQLVGEDSRLGKRVLRYVRS